MAAGFRKTLGVIRRYQVVVRVWVRGGGICRSQQREAKGFAAVAAVQSEPEASTHPALHDRSHVLLSSRNQALGAVVLQSLASTIGCENPLLALTQSLLVLFHRVYPCIKSRMEKQCPLC